MIRRLLLAMGALVAAAGLIGGQPAFAQAETPRQEMEYWLTCGMSYGGYKSLQEDAPTEAGAARMTRMDALLPRISTRVDTLISQQGLDSGEVSATLDRLGGVFKAELENLYTEPDFYKAVTALIEPRLDTCETRARRLPAQ